MEVFIFSDSHGRSSGMELALERQIRRPGAVIHLGDGARDLQSLELGDIPLYNVRGNCDTFLYGVPDAVPEELLATIGGVSVFMTHGHRYGVKGGLGALLAAGAQKGVDVVLFGHTHRPYEEIIPAGTELGGVVLQRPMYVFNPGSIGRNEDGEGRSFGTLTIQNNNILLAHGRI